MVDKSIVVITAHVGDFVWRCGGAIALHAELGVPVQLVCLSYGENGESNSAWAAQAQNDRQAVKEIRRAEAERAAALLGVESLHFYDLGDYPLPESAETVDRLSRVLRAAKPQIIVTHPEKDPSNLDHCRTFNMVLGARMKAIAPGHGADFIQPPQVLCFEPHQPELCGFKPDTILDITPVWEKKQNAMQVMATQKNLWTYYERVALQRGAQGGRRAQKASMYGEAYQTIFPSARASFF